MDWFTRGIAILGLIVSILAITIPYIQSQNDSEELLSIKITPEEGDGIIRLADDINKSRAIQVPYIITLSNVGKVKLSITDYKIHQVWKNKGMKYFNGLNGGLHTIEYKAFSLPKNIDSGESITFRAYIGFLPSIEIHNYLHQQYELNGSLKVKDVFLSLAKKGLTIYGGKAKYEEFDKGSYQVVIDYKSDNYTPVYNIQFITGRNSSFVTFASESIPPSL